MTDFDIGILAGSGPEAGIDLWQAVLDERRRRLGPAYRGDLDAPSVVVRSEPRLGLSMDLAAHGETVATATLEHAVVLDASCRAWAIACNTINRFTDRLDASGSADHLVSFVDAVEGWLDRLDPEATVALVGARPIADLGADSAYRALAARFVAVPESVRERVHSMISEIKRVGPPFGDVRAAFARLVDEIDADRIVLGCTELPLVADPYDDRLVDVTRLVAAELLDRLESP